jgi:hypothetical protein
MKAIDYDALRIYPENGPLWYYIKLMRSNGKEPDPEVIEGLKKVTPKREIPRPGSKLAGLFAVLLGIGLPLGAIYLLVQFVKFARKH